MTEQPQNDPAGGQHTARNRGHSGHSWMMIACCIPMIVIAIALVATGVASPSLLLAAAACTAMMALMMRGMDHGRAPQEEGDPSEQASNRW